MKREKIAIMVIVAIVAAILTTGFTLNAKEKLDSIPQKYVLKNVDNQQEESPSLVSDGKSKMWIYTLRRIEFPKTVN